MMTMKKKLLTIGAVVLVCMTFTGCDRTAPEISGIEEVIEIQCGDEFNLDNYLDDILTITDTVEEETKTYKLKDLEYAVAWDESVYDAESGNVETAHFGEHDVRLTVKDEAGNKTEAEFKVKMNPLVIEEGFYVYKNDYSDDFELMGYCSFKNTSEDFLQIDNVEFAYFDKDGVSLGTNNGYDYAPMYLEEGDLGFSMDTFGTMGVVVSGKDDVSRVEVQVDYSLGDEEENNTLDIGKLTITNGFEYNKSGFAANTIVTNPYEKDVELYLIMAGMYDKNGKLIGVMDNLMNNGSIGAKSSVKSLVAWLPDSDVRPDQTKEVKAAACVIRFADE